MQELTAQEYKDEEIRNGIAIRDLLETPGWKLIDELLELKKEQIVAEQKDSYDPIVIISCVRKKDGIMFIYDVIQDFLRVGDEASIESAV